MAKNQTIQHKRSTLAGNKPSAAQVAVGELAINFADKSIYTKTAGGTIIELARDVVKSGTQPSSPTDGDMWYDTPNDTMNVWDGTKWVNVAYSGKDVLAANTTASPTWASGSGTSASPYAYTITTSGGATVQVTSVTITGLAPDQFVPVIDLNSTSNGGRFTVSNNFTDSSGTLRFNIVFTDLPVSANGASLTANLRIGTATIYINVVASIGSPFPQTVSFPTNTQAVTSSWTAANDTLTSTGDLLISLDGVTFGTGPLAITTGATLYTKWTGAAGSGLGIDGANGATITGAVVASGGGSTSSSLTIDKTPATITFTAATGAALSTAVDSNTVTLSGVNSYVYLTSANTMMASIAGATPTSVPASGTTMYAVSGQTLQVRQTSSATSATTTTVTITAGGTTAGFSVTTASAGTINQPSITSPISGSTGISSTATITSSAYAVTGIVGTHLNTDWEIFTNSAMTGAAAFSSLASTTNLTTWSPTGLSGLTQYWARVRYRSNDGTVVVSSYSPTVTWTTAADAGAAWTNQTSLSTSTWGATASDSVKDIIWNGSKYVVVGGGGSSAAANIASSADGVSWTDVVLDLNTTGWGNDTEINSIAWNGSLFVIVGEFGRVATSSDGIAWTNQTSLSTSAWGAAGTASNVQKVIWNGSRFLAVGPGSKVARSTNGTAWTYEGGLITAGGSTTSTKTLGPVWDGAKFVVIVDETTGPEIYTSVTGSVWTLQTTLAAAMAGTISGITWDGTKYLIYGTSGLIQTSTNLTTWTNQTGLSLTAWGTATVNEVIWTGSQYVAVGAAGTAATSPNGTTWTYQSGLSATAYGATGSLAIATNGAQLVVGGPTGKIATSP